ncbi:MAG: hypothetical protein M0Z30_19465, partial [Actinomycetota bacterium]|nr:hypothetical protein [Actinomycetota bacterium]
PCCYCDFLAHPPLPLSFLPPNYPNHPVTTITIAHPPPPPPPRPPHPNLGPPRLYTSGICPGKAL